MKNFLRIMFLYFIVNTTNAQIKNSDDFVTFEKVTFDINSDSKEDELKERISFMKKQHSFDLEIKNISRNKEGKITSINISYNDNNGNTGSKNIKATEPIKPITFTFSKDKKGNTNTSISNANYEIKKYSLSDVKYSDNIVDSLIQKSHKKTVKVTRDKDGKVEKTIIENGKPIQKNDSIFIDDIVTIIGKSKFSNSDDNSFTFTFENLEELGELKNLEKLGELDIFESLKSLKSLESLKSLKNLENLNPNTFPEMKVLEEQMKKLKEEMELMKKELEENKKELKNTKKI